jgi:hypothetical protein
LGHVFNRLFGQFGLYMQVTISEPVPKRVQKWTHFGSFWLILGTCFEPLFGHFGLYLQVTIPEPVPKRVQKRGRFSGRFLDHFMVENLGSF